MTINIPAKAARSVLAYDTKHPDGELGFQIQVSVESVFVTDADAAKLADYITNKIGARA